eukprot:XP_011669581.1 PREDICTED: uncharacterized protein LOC105440764 [Strongylocentrotus purpuratus]
MIISVESIAYNSYSMASYRMELPEVFTGENGKDFRQWIRRFEVAAQAFSDTSINLTTLLPARLAGSAFIVWESLSASDKKDFKKMKEKLSQVFGRTQFIDTFKSCITARTRQPGEPLEVFASAIASLVEEAFPSYDDNAKGGERFRRFVAGVDKPLQVKIHELGGFDFDEALKIALRVERAHQAHDFGMVAAVDDRVQDKTPAEASVLRLLLPRLNELEKKLDRMSLKLETVERPSRSQQRGGSPSGRAHEGRHMERRGSPSPSRDYRRHRSPEYTRQRSPEYARHRSPGYSRHRSPEYAGRRSPEYARRISPSPNQSYACQSRTSPSRRPYESSSSRNQQHPSTAGYQVDSHRQAPYRQVRFEDQQQGNFW